MELISMGEPADGNIVPSSLPPVLVVDDELLGITSVNRSLRGYAELTFASTFAEAKRLLEGGEAFDALVFDVLLDQGTGLDLLAFARGARYVTTPAILLTGSLRSEWVNAAHALGAELLTKPYPTEQLRNFVRRVASARAVGVPKPSSPPPRSLHGCIAELRKLVDGPQDWRVRYTTGEIAKELEQHPERYGPHALALVAGTVGIDGPTLYRTAKVAERWTLEEVGALFARKMRDGRLLSWKHVVALASIEHAELREQLLRRAIDQCLPASAIEDAAAKS
jgi:CheY-like chemotaxis protein